MSDGRAQVLVVGDEPEGLGLSDGPGYDLVRIGPNEDAARLAAGADCAAVLVAARGPDGLAAAGRIRGHAPHVPIVFLAAADGADFPLREAEALGAFDCVLAPVVPGVLRAKLAFLAQLHLRNRELRALACAEGPGRAELRASEERFRFLDALNRAARSLADPGAVMGATARLLGEHLGVTRTAYADVEPDGDRFTIRHDWTDGAASTVGVYSLGAFGGRAAADMRGGRTLVVRDVGAELAPADGRDTFDAIGIKGIVCCPLVKDGRLLAMMAVHSAAPRDWTAAEVALVEAVVERSWAHIERVRAAAEAADDRAKLAAVFAGMSQGVVLLDPDGAITAMNRAALDLHGFADEAEMARRVGEFPALFEATDPDGRPIPPDDWPAARAARGEPVADAEIHVRRRDTGRAFVGLYSASLVRAADGRVRLVVLAVADVTDRVRAEARVKESEARFRLLAETIPQLAFMARPDGHVFWYNRRWYEYTGTTPERMEGWGWQAVHHPEALPRVVERWRASIATGAPFDMVFPLRGADGAFRPFLTRINPLADAGGAVVMWFGTGTDIADQKRAEEVLREQDRRKDEFIALFAHELRNPLAPMRTRWRCCKLRQDAGTVERVRGWCCGRSITCPASSATCSRRPG
jgi:PAS domain S-box-containing protein